MYQLNTTLEDILSYFWCSMVIFLENPMVTLLVNSLTLEWSKTGTSYRDIFLLADYSASSAIEAPSFAIRAWQRSFKFEIEISRIDNCFSWFICDISLKYLYHNSVNNSAVCDKSVTNLNEMRPVLLGFAFPESLAPVLRRQLLLSRWRLQDAKRGFLCSSDWLRRPEGPQWRWPARSVGASLSPATMSGNFTGYSAQYALVWYTIV